MEREQLQRLVLAHTRQAEDRNAASPTNFLTCRNDGRTGNTSRGRRDDLQETIDGILESLPPALIHQRPGPRVSGVTGDVSEDVSAEVVLERPRRVGDLGAERVDP